MKACWRWFGPEDPVSLDEIRQTGAEGIVTSLHHIPAGEVWSREEIRNRIAVLKEKGFPWEVVESLPVHEVIKLGKTDREKYISNYLESMQNLASEQVHHIVFNFMALTDWTRTDLAFSDTDGATTIRYDATDLAMFDLYILKRTGAEMDHSEKVQEEARARFENISEDNKKSIEKTILMGLPGTVEDLSLEEFREKLAEYHAIGKTGLRNNLLWFLQRVIPKAEELNLILSVHADDPPWSIFGLPRVVSDHEDLYFLMGNCTSSALQLCFCSGTLGASRNNNIEEILRRHANRVSFAHLRNIKFEDENSFYESKIFEGDLDMVRIARILSEEQRRRGTGMPIPFRPDHGQTIFNDVQKGGYPGYAATGRLKSISELNGIFKTLDFMLDSKEK